MMRTVTPWIWIPILLLACGEPRPETEPVADVVVTFDGGAISLTEVERRSSTARTPACRALRRTAGGGSLEELLPCYREVAEALTLERLVLTETPDVDRALEDLGQRYLELRRHAFLNPYYQELREEIEISDEEVEAHFAENQESFRRPGRRVLWNIFRRHKDGTTPEETDTFLLKLKERFLAGEPFGALAREHSQSETRLRDGLVGPVSEGKLPPRLEEIAFALGEGEVSDPIRVRGGAVLLHVSNAVDGVDPGLAGVRQQIRRQLRQQKVAERVAQRVAGREPPAGSISLGPEELVAALDGDDPERVVFEIAGERLTAADLRALAGLSPSQQAGDLADADQERLHKLYGQRTEQQLLLLELFESADPETRRKAEERLREGGLPELVDEGLRAEMWKLVDRDPEVLRQYYEDNRSHYQNPLRFKLVAWDLPFGDDPPRQLERMEELHKALSAGEIDLAAAAGRLGGNVRELGWQGFEDLAGEIPNKARTYMLQATAGGFSVPYQQDEALHILRIEEREEPRPLGYEEVAQRVREDYLERFRQRLYREVAEVRLTAAGFVFHEDETRRLLAPAENSSG